jgi:hypothetical protein
MTSNLNSSTISQITEQEKQLTGSDQPVKGGPTAQAQKHAGETISSSAVSDITKGEQKITGESSPRPGGPAATAQSHLAGVRISSTKPNSTDPSIECSRPKPDRLSGPSYRQTRLKHHLQYHSG